MKKFLTLLLALVMALSIVGCGKTNTDEPQAPDTPMTALTPLSPS